MSRAEEITSEVRRLVMTCRALEAQLKQSVPKKEYEEAIAKKNAEIENLSTQLAETRSELERVVSTGTWAQDIRTSLDSQRAAIETQTQHIENLSEGVERGTVSNEFYAQSLERIKELEAEVQELRASTVPKSQYEQLRSELERMVPAEQLAKAEARVRELESTISNYVPKHILDELKVEITSLVREALATVVLETTARVESTDQPTENSKQEDAVKIVEQIDSTKSDTGPTPPPPEVAVPAAPTQQETSSTQ